MKNHTDALHEIMKIHERASDHSAPADFCIACSTTDVYRLWPCKTLFAVMNGLGEDTVYDWFDIDEEYREEFNALRNAPPTLTTVRDC